DRLRDRERTTNRERELVNFRASRVGNAQSKQGDQPQTARKQIKSRDRISTKNDVVFYDWSETRS
ncbi:hypothetical protein LINGRAHAP2_LOCUS31989, partial [Linum grandiflorum]